MPRRRIVNRSGPMADCWSWTRTTRPSFSRRSSIRETVLFAASGAPESVAITTAVGARMIFVLVDVLGAALCAPFVRKRAVPSDESGSPDLAAPGPDA